jgi:hypothetical protein
MGKGFFDRSQKIRHGAASGAAFASGRRVVFEELFCVLNGKVVTLPERFQNAVLQTPFGVLYQQSFGQVDNTRVA